MLEHNLHAIWLDELSEWRRRAFSSYPPAADL